MSRLRYKDRQRTEDRRNDADRDAAALRVAPRLEVGRVDDPAEAEADLMAAKVVAALNGAGATQAPVSASPGRVRRRATDDRLGGMPVAADVEQRIRRAGPGRPLPDATRTAMEGAFGADLGNVRAHVDSAEAVDLHADAFTLGSDIHFAPGRFDPASAPGQELLAHELTHVLQQTGGAPAAQRRIGDAPAAQRRAGDAPAAQRRIQRKLWTQKEFDTKTSESMFTRRSTAQDEIRKMLDQYQALYLAADPSPKEIPSVLATIGQMRAMAVAWMTSHTYEVESQDALGNTVKDKKEDANRSNRMVGMKAFVASLDAEKARLERSYVTEQKKKDPKADETAVKASLGLATEQATNAEAAARTKKVTDHYEGSAPSAFRHLGRLIDLAAPNVGDSTKVELEAFVPVDPTGSLFLGLHFVSEIERSKSAKSDKQAVKMKTRIGVVFKGSITNAASISGELGGYIEVQAPTGADCAELISYELYRRARESKWFPHDAVSYMWGGRASGSGAAKADKWSLDLEKRLFGLSASAPTLAQHNGDWAAFAAARDAWLASNGTELDKLLETYVETGAYAEVKAKGGVNGLVELEGAVSGQLGRRIDFLSLMNRKGGAGAKNVKSDSVMNMSGRAEKNVGRTVGGFTLEFKATAGPLEGAGKFVAKWLSDGKRETKGETASKEFDWELELEGTGKLPFTEMIGGQAGGTVAGVVAAAVKAIRAKAQAEGNAETSKKNQVAGTIIGGSESAAIALTQVAKVPKAAWTPSLALDPEMAPGEMKHGGNIGIKLKIAANKDGVEVTLNMVKDTSLEVAGIFKASIEKTERLVGFRIVGGAFAVI